MVNKKAAAKTKPPLGTSTPKKGRPVTVGATVYVPAKWPPALIERVDAWSKAAGVGRSEALRRLVELGLNGKRRAVK